MLMNADRLSVKPTLLAWSPRTSNDDEVEEEEERTNERTTAMMMISSYLWEQKMILTGCLLSAKSSQFPFSNLKPTFSLAHSCIQPNYSLELVMIISTIVFFKSSLGARKFISRAIKGKNLHPPDGIHYLIVINGIAFCFRPPEKSSTLI